MSATEIQAFELSPQQRLHWQLNGGATPRTTTVTAAVSREIPVESLVVAISAAVARHEILRTTYRQIPGLKYPLQLIHDSLPPDVRLKESRETPFDLDQGPVFRLAFRESSEDLQLSLSAPSIGCDPESLRVVLDEARAILKGECLAPDPIQYADYAAWVNEMAGAPEAVAGVEYWARISDSRHLGAELFLRQNPDRQRPETVGIAPLPARLWSAVSDVPSDAERQLAAAWFHLIGRHCDRDALVGGFVFRGRSLPNLTRAVGAYARCLPVEIEIGRARKWRQLVEQIDQRLAQAESWQDCYKPPESPLALPASFECTHALEASAADVLAQTASGDRAELHLHVRLEGQARSGGITFDRRCYSDGAAAELADQLAETLAPMSRRAVWKGTTSGPADASILDRIAEHARLGPDHPAIRSASDVLTYRELDRRSDSLAAHLRSIGTGPGSLVPIYFDRGPWFVVAALGVMKAGAAYVPLDPDYPADRNEFFIRESRSSLVLTQSGVAASLPASDRCTLIVDALNETPAPVERPRFPNTNLAYVIFTSGSTGDPKGVAVSHRSLLSSTLARNEVYPGTVESMLLLSALAFDSSVAGIFWTLSDGGTLHIASRASLRDPARIASIIDAERITHTQLLPSLFHLVLEQDASLKSLRAVTVAGEACPASLIQLHHQRIPDTLLVNEYGPTESTVWTTAHVCGLANRKRVSIGQSAGHVDVAILDHEIRDLPAGITGEIAVGGEGLADGYWHDPVLTAQRFLPDPRPGRCGSRVYRTGDLGYVSENGCVEFLGRLDEQVKIRGFRVEPVGIESVLLESPVIQEACVVAVEGRLRAFVSVCSGGSVDHVRNFIRTKLPDYMVPSTISVLSQLPKTPNGKVDRGALREAGRIPEKSKPGTRLPATRIQRELAEIWCSIMRLDSVGIDDNFFEAGGDSIQILRIRGEAAKRGLAFELADMLERPTIASLEQVVEKRVSKQAEAVLQYSMLDEQERFSLPEHLEDAYPATALQAHMLRLSDEPAFAGMYHDVMSCEVDVPFDRPALEASVDSICQRNEILRTTFHLSNSGRLLQYVRAQAEVTLAIVDLRGFAAAEQQRITTEFVQSEPLRPFEHAKAPLLRLAIHRLTERTARVTLTSHHAVLDGWSATSLLVEWIEAYLAIAEGRSPPLTISPPRFAPFVQQELEAEASAQFWQDTVREFPPTILGGESAASAVRERISRVLNRDLVNLLQSCAAAEGIPIACLLLTAHLHALAEEMSMPRILSGQFAHARSAEDGADRGIGLFLNFLPVPYSVKETSWSNRIRQIWDEQREAFPHRQYPFYPRASAAEMPMFDTSFNYLHFYLLEPSRLPENIGILSAESINVNEFAWNTVFRRTDGGLALEGHFDPARVGGERALRLVDRIVGALREMSSGKSSTRSALFDVPGPIEERKGGDQWT
jgi:amino acid adenylation domain-containing protein